jgi:hypothetical protein
VKEVMIVLDMEGLRTMAETNSRTLIAMEPPKTLYLSAAGLAAAGAGRFRPFKGLR